MIWLASKRFFTEKLFLHLSTCSTPAIIPLFSLTALGLVTSASFALTLPNSALALLVAARY
jgi:hypothetical protein